MTMAARLLIALAVYTAAPAPQSPTLPSTPLAYGVLSATFAADGTFVISGQGWGKITGTWKAANGEIELVNLVNPNPNAPANCAGPGKYRYTLDGRQEMRLGVRVIDRPPRIAVSV